MKRSTPSLDEAICIAATTGAPLRAVFTFNVERLGTRGVGASLRIVGDAEAVCGHHAQSVDAHDEIASFVVTAVPAVIMALCQHPAVTTGSVYHPECRALPAGAAGPATWAAA